MTWASVAQSASAFGCYKTHNLKNWGNRKVGGSSPPRGVCLILPSFTFITHGMFPRANGNVFPRFTQTTAFVQEVSFQRIPTYSAGVCTILSNLKGILSKKRRVMGKPHMGGSVVCTKTSRTLRVVRIATLENACKGMFFKKMWNWACGAMMSLTQRAIRKCQMKTRRRQLAVYF